MKNKFILFVLLISTTIITSYAQDACPANWGSATIKLINNENDIDKVCAENASFGNIVKEANNSSGNTGRGNGYTWKKVNGTLTIMYDTAKFSFNSIKNILRKYFKK